MKKYYLFIFGGSYTSVKLHICYMKIFLLYCLIF